MTSRCCLLSFLWLRLLCVAAEPVLAVKVGVVLDLNSTVGRVSKTSIKLAFSEFYAENPEYKTRLSPVFRNAGDVVGVVSAVSSLFIHDVAAMKLLRDEVDAIIGPQTSEQARFLVEYGRKYEIPVISFTATSSSLSPIQNRYFIRTAEEDSAQVEAINAIIQNYGWREIVPIYEDTEFGHGIIPYLADALQQNGTLFVCRSVIPSSSTDTKISNELNRLKDMRKRIFLLHMTASLGSKLLAVAKKEQMMTKGYAWIVTDELSSLLDPITDSNALHSMQGIVGVRPYINVTERLKNFQTRLSKLPHSLGIRPASPNLFALQAYDTVWALAMAVEKVHSTFPTRAMRKNLPDTIRSTTFKGISGDFNLVNGELKRSTFEIFNLVDEKESIIGSWGPKKGSSEEVDEAANSISKLRLLKQPIWPGDTTEQPLMNITVGIPVKQGYPEFVKVDMNDHQKSSGFCIDVFRRAVEKLQIPIEFWFVPFANNSGGSNGTYNELLHQIAEQKVDAVVGDTTIVANRSNFVDFTLPYSESGVAMLVSMTNDTKNMWIFLKPFSWDLWLVSFISFIFTGFVVWLLECRVNDDFGGPPQQQLGSIFWFTFSTLVFAHRERILNNLSRFLLIIWIFVVLILTQSYTANLSSMLTAKRLKPSFVDVSEIKEKGYFVGFLVDSFVRELLISQLGFSEDKLKSYGNPEEFREALSKGSDKGGVAAIFDEIPYIRVFLSRFGSGYQMVGPTYKTGGFGFAFPKGSPLVAHFSRAILNVTEDQNKMDEIEKAYFSSQDDKKAASDDTILDAYSFAGLFIITAVATLSSLLIYLTQFLLSHWPESSTTHCPTSFASKLVQTAKLFHKKHFDSSSLPNSEPRVHPATPESDTDHLNPTDQTQNLRAT